MHTDVLTVLLLFVGLMVGLEAGRWVGRRAGESAGKSSGHAAADGVVFAVLGLLIAFIFTASAARFDHRRELIVQQANAYSTVWSRIDLMPVETQESIREPLRQWLDIAGHLTEQVQQHGDHPEQLAARVEALQAGAWDAAVAAVGPQPTPTGALLLASMNQWADLTNSRKAMDNLGLPPMVLPTLVGLSLLAAVLVGHGIAADPRRGRLHETAFALAICLSIYIILDLNGPRAGLIRLDAMDQQFRQLAEPVPAVTTEAQR